MNVKLISKALHTLSLLSDEDYELVLELHALTEDERGMLMTVLEPQKPATKKASRKSSTSKSATKSERASGMAAQLKSRVNEQRQAATTTKDDSYDPLTGLRCSREGCGWLQGDLIHDPQGGYAGYHPFQPSTTAPPAPALSPANGGAGSTTANSEIAKDTASTVHHAGG